LSICPGKHYVTAPLAQGLLGCLRRSFQLEVLLLADLRADGFRAERRLHHEIVPQPIEKRACIINKLTPVNRGRGIFAVTDFLFNKLTRGNPRLTCSTLPGVTCHPKPDAEGGAKNPPLGNGLFLVRYLSHQLLNGR